MTNNSAQSPEQVSPQHSADYEYSESYDDTYERMKNILGEGKYLLDTSFPADVARRSDNLVKRGNTWGYTSLGNVYGEGGSAAELDTTSKALGTYANRVKDEFVENGVSELITVISTEEIFPPRQSLPYLSESERLEDGDKIVKVVYETLSSSGGIVPFFGHFDEVGRPGNTVTMELFLPATNASELMKIIHEYPEEIRTMLDVVAGKVLVSDEAWDKIRPDFDQWEQNTGGRIKFGFRTDLTQALGDSEIVEFEYE